MNNTVLGIILFLLASCVEKKTSKLDFEDAILEMVIKKSNGKPIEFQELYDSLTEKIPNDNEEKLLLVQKLKAKGFKVTNWGRGNHPLGPRIVILNLKKGDCECTVTKKYYSTSDKTVYSMAESVSCKRVSL